ncbi:unnamed protein product [Linum trigynum]|uniref:Uncharacterized protein n=1 Tax=Linum trigynum TaxID=586398 RepID=A0AAV2FT62_9ROSI
MFPYRDFDGADTLTPTRVSLSPTSAPGPSPLIHEDLHVPSPIVPITDKNEQLASSPASSPLVESQAFLDLFQQSNEPFLPLDHTTGSPDPASSSPECSSPADTSPKASPISSPTVPLQAVRRGDRV